MGNSVEERVPHSPRPATKDDLDAVSPSGNGTKDTLDARRPPRPPYGSSRK